MHRMRGGSVSHSLWESHFSAVNSRWLQENLQNMDSKVKSMMKLIGEDVVDSFGRKRPELVSLVEEFHGAYCALAERYDGLAGEVRKNIPGVLKEEEEALPETITIDEAEVPPRRILGGRTAVRRQLRRSPKVDPDEIPHPESHRKEKNNKSMSSSSSSDSSSSDSDSHHSRGRNIDKSKLEILRGSLEGLPNRLVYEVEENAIVRSDMEVLQEQLEGLEKSSKERYQRYEDELLHSNGKLAALKDEKLSLEGVKTELELKVLDLSAVCSTLKGETTQLREEAKDLRIKMQESEREKVQEHLILQQMHQSKCKQLEEEVAHHRDEHKKMSANSSVQMKALEKERASLTTLVAELDAQAKFYLENCSRLEGEMASSKEAVENLRGSLQESEMKKMELATLEERSKERCGYLEQEVVYLRDEHEKLITSSRTQLQILEEEKASLNRIVEETTMLRKEEHVNLTAQIRSLKEEKVSLNAMINEMKDQVKSWSGKYSILEEETLVLKGENDELRENLLQNDREHSTQLQSLSQRGEDRCRMLEEEIQYHIDELGKVRVNSSAELQSVIEEKASLSRVNTELDDRIKLFSEECSDLKEEVLKMKHENAELRGRFGEVEAEKGRAESEVGTLQQLLSSVGHEHKVRCHELQQEISNLTEVSKMTASQLHITQHLVKGLEEEKSLITLERNRLHEEIDYLRVEVVDLKNNLEETVKQKQELELEMDELRQVNIRAQEDTSRLKELCDVHERKTHEVEEKVSMQKMELSELREAIATKVEEVSALQEDTRKLHAMLENVKQEKTGLSVSLDNANMMLKTTEERCNQLQDRISSLEEEKLQLLNEKSMIHTHSRGLEEAGFTLQKGKELLESELASWKQRAEEMQAEIDELRIEEGRIRVKHQILAEKDERAQLTTQSLQQELEAAQANCKMTAEQCHQYAEECSIEKEKVRLSEEEISFQRVRISELQEEGSLKDGKVIALQGSLSEMEELFAFSEKKLQEQSLENQKYLAAVMIQKEEHEKLRVQMQALEEEKASLNAMVTEIKAQVKSWSGKCSILQEETLVLKGEKEELREKLLQNDREHTQLLSLSQRGEDRCRHLEEEIQYHIDELEKVRVNSSEQLQTVMEEKASLSRVNIELNDRIKLLSEECSNLKEDVLEMKHESEAVRGRFQDLEAEKERAESEVGTLQQLLSSVGHEHEARCHELQQEILNLKEACHTTAAELDSTHHLVKNLEEEKSSLTLETNRLCEEVGSLRNSFEEQTKQKQSLELEMEELKQVNIKAQEDILRLKELCDVHERRTREVEEKVSMQQMELSKVGEAISSKVEEVSTLQEEIKKLQKILENVIEEKSLLSVKLDNLSMMLKTTEEKCNQLHNQVSSLEEEKLQLLNEKSIIHTHSRGLEEAGFTLQKRKELLESEAASWKQKAEELQAKIDELRIEEGTIREKLQISVEKEESVRLAMQSLQQELEAAQSNYRNTAEECSTEKEKVRLSDEEILFQRVRISELQEEGSLKDGKVVALQGSLSKMEELFASSEKKLQEQSLEYQKCMAAVIIQKEEQEKLRQALEEEKASLDTMLIETKTQVKSLSGKYSILEEETLVLKGENEKLREKLLQNDREHAQLLSLKQRDEDRCRKLEEEIQYHINELGKVRVDSRAQFQAVMEEKASLSRVNVELDDRIKLLSEECSNLKEEVLKMKHESAELGGRFQEVEAEKRRVESEVGTLQQLLSSAGHEHKRRCHELQQEISDLTEVSRMTEGQLHSTQHLVKSLEEEKSAMTLERSRLHEEADNLRVEVGSLRNSLVEQTNQKQALELQMDELKQVNTRAEEDTLRLKELCDVHERKTCEVEEKVSMQKMELSKLVEAISSKVEEVSMLKEETKNLQSMLENVKKENTGLSVELANGSMMVKTTEERCKQLQDHISALEEEKVQLSNEKSVIHTHLRGLEESRFALQKGKEDLESELDLWKQRTEGVQGEINEMKIEISKLTEVSQMTATQLHSTQQLVKSLEEEKSSLTSERSRLHEEVDNLSVELGRLQNSFEERMKQKQELELKMNDLEQVNIKAQEDTLRLKELCDVYEKKTCEGEEKVSVQQMELSILGEAVASKVEEVSTLQEEIRKLQSILENAKKEKIDLSVELDSASMMLKTKEERCNQLQDRVSSLEEEKVQLSNAKLIIDTHLTRVEEAGCILQKGKEALESELASWKKRADKMQTEINESRMEISKLEEISQMTETQLHSTQDLVKNLEEEKSSSTLERSRLHEEVDHLRVELGCLQNSLDEQTKQKQALDLEMDELKQVNIMAQEDILRLKESCDVHERKIHQEEEKVSMKQMELLKLGEAIVSKVEEVSALQEETRKLQAMLENVKKEKTGLSVELDNVSMMLKTTEERCNQLQDQVSSLEEEKVQLSNEKSVIHTHSRGLEEASFTLQKGKELLESEMASWKQKAEEMRAEINELRIEILKLTEVSQQLHSTQDLVKNLEEEKSSSTLERSRLHEEVDHLRVELGSLQNSLDEQTKQKQALDLEMDELKQVNIMAQEDILRLKESCDVHERKIHQEEEKVSMKQMELLKLGEAIVSKVEEVSALQEETRKLQAMLENVKKEKTGLSVELDNVSMMLKTTEERCNQLQDQVSSLEEEKVQLSNEKSVIHTHSRGLEEASFTLQKGKELLESEMASWKQKAEEMRAEINELRIEILKLTEVSQQLHSTQDLVKNLEEEKSSSTLERSRLHEEVDHLRVELGSLQNSLDEQTKQKQALDLEMDELKQVNIMAQEDILRLKESCDVHERKIHQEEEKVSMKQMELLKLGEAIVSKVEEVSALQEETRKLQAMLENVKKEKTGLSVELDNVSMMLKTTEERCNQLQDQVSSLEEEKVQLSNEKSVIHTHSRGLEEASFTLQKGKELLESEMASWKQKAEEMRAEINELRIEILKLTEVSQQLHSTQDLVKNLEEEKSSSTLERSRLHEEVDHLRVELGSLQNSLDEQTKQKQALDLEMDELKQVNIMAQEDILRLKESCDVHERKIHQEEEKVSMKQMELLKLGEAIVSKVEEVSALQEETRKLQAMLENVKKEKTGLSVELDNVSMMLKTTEERCNQLQDQVSSLEEEKVQLSNEKSVIHTHSRGLEEASFTLQKGKELLESEMASWKQKAEEMRAEINELRIEILKLTEVSQQLNSTQHLVKHLEEEKSSLTLEGSMLREEVDHLRVEVGSLQNSLEERTKQKQALDLEMDELKMVNIRAQEDTLKLKELCAVHERKTHEVEEKVSMQQMELSKLGEAIAFKVEEISTLQGEIGKLQSMLENIEKEKTGLSVKLDNVSMMMKTTEERCNQLQDQASSLEEEKVQLSNEKLTIHTHSRGLEESGFILQKGKEALESELASWKQRAEGMQAEIKESRIEISKLAEASQMAETQLCSAQDLIKILEEEKSSFTLERSRLHEEVDHLRVELGRLRNSLDEQTKLKQALDLEMDELKQVNIMAQEDILRLKESCDVHEMKTLEGEKKMSMQQMEVSKLGKAIASKVEEISTLQEEIRKLQAMIENIKTEKTGLSVELENVSMMLKTTGERCDQLHDQVFSLEEEKVQLSNEKSIIHTHSRGLEEVSFTLQKGKELLESELASWKQRAEEMQAEINESRREISNLTEVSQMTATQLHNTQHLVKHLEEEKSSLTLERSRLCEEVDNLRVEVGSLQNSLEERTKQKQALELEMDELEQVNIRAQEDTLKLKELCDVHERKTWEVEEKVSVQQMELSELGEAIASKVEEISTLKNEIRKLQSMLENVEKDKTGLSVELDNASMMLKTTEERCNQLQDHLSSLEEEKVQLSNEKLTIHTHSRGLEEAGFILQKGKEALESELASWKQRAEGMQVEINESRIEISKLTEVSQMTETQLCSTQDLVKNLEEEKSSSTLEKSRLHEEVDHLRAELGSLRNSLEEQTKQKQALDLEMDELKQVNVMAQEDILRLKELCNVHEMKIHEEEEKVSMKQIELSKLGEAIASKVEEISTLQKEIRKLQEMIENITTEKTGLSTELDNVSMMLKTTEKKCNQLQDQVSSLEEEKVQLSNEKSIIHTHSRALEEVSFSLQKGKELLESELASWKQRTEEMQAEINESRREISNLTEVSEMSATQLHNTQHLVKKLEEEKSSLTLERSGLCVEVDNLRVEVGSLWNSLEDQSKQKQALELELDVLEQMNIRAQEETFKLKELCDVHETKTHEVEKKASMQQMELSKLGEAIASQVEEISTHQEENKKLQSMLENVEKEKTAMSVDLDNVSMMLKTTEERCNQLQEGKEFLESELASSKQRAERMQGEINELRIEISKLTEVSQMTETQLHRTQDLVKNLEEEKSSLTLERSRLHEEVDNLRVEVGSLQNSLEELVKQKQALELEMDELEQVNIKAGEDTSRLKELCDMHERKTCEVEEKVYMQQMELSKLGGAIASKVEEVSTFQEEIRKLQSLLENVKEEKTCLSIELDNAGTVLKATEDRCHQLHDQISCLEEEKLQLLNEKLIIHTHSRGLEESRFTLQKGKEELERELALWKQRAEEVQGKFKERLKLSAEEEEKSQLMMQSLQKELEAAQASYMMTVEECSAEREKAKALEALISELQQEGSLQNGKIAALHFNMVKMEELLALSESKIQEQSLELQKYLAESSSAQEIANLLKTQIENLQQQALIASEKLGMLEQEKLLLDEEQRGLHEEITRLRDSLRNLTEKQNSLQSDNQNLRKTVSDQGEKIHRLQEQLDGKTQSGLLQEHNLKLKFRVLQKALINIKQEDRDSREISEVVPREATIDVKETMEEELERLEELLTVSNEGSKKLKSEYGDILERCMALQEDIVKSEISISSLKQENSVQADQILTVLAQNHTLQESKAFLEKEAVQKDGHIQKLKEELSQMQEEGEQAREELQSATGKVSLLEEENQKFCQALSLAEDETKDYKVRGSVLEEKIEMLQKLYSSLETEHGALKHESKRGLDESVFLDKRLREVQDELSLQKDESARLKGEISDALEKTEALTAENKRLQQEKEACTIEIVSGAKRIEGLLEEMSNLRGEIAKKLQEEDEKIWSFQTLSKQYEEDKKGFERGVQAYAELNAMHSIATERLQSLEEQNALLAKQVALSTTRIKVLETEAEKLLTEKAITDDKLASRSDHASKLEEQVSTTQPLLARLNQEVDERNVQIQKLQESLKKANQSLVDARQKEAQEMINLQGKLEAVVNELNTGLEDENVEIKPQLLGIEEEKMKLVNVASFRTACLEETKRMVSTMKEEPVAVKSESSKTKEILQTATGESHLVEGDIHSSLQEMFAKLESNANNMQSSIKNLEDKNGELWRKLSDMHDENGRLLQEISAKTSQIKKMEQTMATMKEERVIIEAEVRFRIHQVNQAQEEVSRLKQEQKTANSDYEAMMKRLQSVEDEVCTLQMQNQHLGQEVAELMKTEKHFSIALRFTRAEASHLVEKTKMLREEIGKKDIRIKGLEATLYDKDQQAFQKLEEEKANLKVELVKVNQEVALLKEESKRQIAIIHDRSEEKREAIRQLCFSIDLLQEKNRNLGRVFDDVREKLKVRGTHVTDR